MTREGNMVEDVKGINIFKINLFSFDFEDENKHNGEHYKKYCIDNNILGWGWPRKNNTEVKTLKEYHKDYGKSRSLSIACNQIAPMKEGDYVWSYVSGQWYLGKIFGDFLFYAPDDYPEFGMQRRCEWKPIENKDLIPGIVLTYSRKDGTIRFIENNASFVKYCQYLYRDLAEKPQNLNFWALAHYEDLEDIVGLYLQKEEGYLIFPSTNKMGTKDYEYMLVQKSEPYKKAIIQCKNNSCISEDNWKKFEEGEYDDKIVYILTIKEDPHTKEKYTKCPETEIFEWSYKGRILVFNSEKLKKWAKDNKLILPERIKKYLEMSE